MMKYYLQLLFIFILIKNMNAQVSFVNGPESVEYDAVNNKYIASSPSDNKIYNVVKGGTATTLVSPVSAPYGMVCIGNNVYVCSSGDVKGYNTTTGTQMFHSIIGGSFLNGLCTDGAGFLYATDFSGKKIYKINLSTSTSSVFTSTGAKTPNGILWDASAGRLVYCTWGANAGLFAVNMSDSTVSSIRTSTYRDFDGVVQDNHHNYYISSWGALGILKVDSALTSVTQVVSGLSNPADIYYNLATDTLAVPNTSGDSVSFHFFGVVDTTADTIIDSTNTSVNPNNQIQYFNVFQNTNNDLICKWASSSKNDLNLNIYSIKGEMILSRKITIAELADGYTTIETSNMTNGIYLFSISDGIYTKTFKTSYQK